MPSPPASRLRSLLNLGLAWLAVFLAAYLVLEALFFCCTAYLFPYAARVSFGFGLYPLLQTTKNGTTPENYVAIFGDSFGFGAGDHFHQVQGHSNPSFNVTHALYARTGRDYVSFAIPGSSNLCGWIEDPLASLQYINSLARFSIEPPAEILLYFYEGNDIGDLWMDLQNRYVERGYELGKMKDPDYFAGFIQHEMLERNRYIMEIPQLRWYHNLMLFRYIANVAEESRNRRQTLEALSKIAQPAATGNNQANVAGKIVSLPDNLQAPPVDMEPLQIEQSLTFINSIARYVKNRFPQSRISIIYIPSTGLLMW